MLFEDVLTQYRSSYVAQVVLSVMISLKPEMSRIYTCPSGTGPPHPHEITSFCTKQTVVFVWSISTSKGRILAMLTFIRIQTKYGEEHPKAKKKKRTRAVERTFPCIVQ